MDEQINLENLFGKTRALPALDPSAAKFFDSKTVGIFGGAGSIGNNVVQALLNFTKAKVVILDNDESRLHTTWVSLASTNQSRAVNVLCDIRDANSVKTCFKRHKIDIVINAAALKHVVYLEEFAREGYLTNVIGAYNVIKYACESGVTDFLFISTDKAVNPTNILGKSKLIGERIVSTFAHEDRFKGINFSCVRFGNVFMSRGSVVETFIAQIRKNENITLHSKDMSRFFIEIDDAANLIIDSISGLRRGITVLDMGEPVSIYQMALGLRKKFGSNVEIVEVGVKAGEKLHEKLVTESEKFLNVEAGKYFTVEFSSGIDLEIIEKSYPIDDESSKYLIEELLISKS